MRNVARNSSLSANLALMLTVVACGGWIWRSHRVSGGEGASSADSNRSIKAYEAFVLDKLGALRLVGLTLPKVVMTSTRGDTISTDLSQRAGALVLLFKPQLCQACLIPSYELPSSGGGL